MDITKDIQPMTALRNNSAQFMRHLTETKRPVILTVNGKAGRCRARRGSLSARASPRGRGQCGRSHPTGSGDLANGETRQAAEVFNEIRAGYGIPR